MPVFGKMEDRGAAFAWVFTGTFYVVFWLAHSFLVPWLTFLRLPRLAESPESGGLQSWADEVMARQGRRPVPVRVHEGGLVNAFVLWGIREPWLLVGEPLASALEKMAMVKRASAKQKGMMHPPVQNRVEAILGALTGRTKACDPRSERAHHRGSKGGA